jgi:hypothetical protein
LTTPIVWLAAIALLAVPGAISWRVPRIARMNTAARFGFALATGILLAALLMYVYALLGIHWSRTNLGLPMLAIAALGFRPRRIAFSRPNLLIIVFFALTTYAIADARATCGDLVFIWAPKAQAFATARTIDVKFLSFPHYYLMHPDYPPLVPLIYAFGTIAAHGFSWWAPLFTALLVLAAIIGVLSGFGAPPRAITFVTGLLTFTFVSAYLPGGADPFLLLFESIAVISLTFEPDEIWIPSFALAGGAFSKVEGLSFAIIVAIAYALSRRRIVRALALLVPTALLIGSWLLFAAKHGLLDQYARANTTVHWPLLGHVLHFVAKFSSYNALWIPWIVAVIPLITSRERRAALLPLLAACGSITSTIFFYLHNAEPGYWIASSADRILVTPLMCIAVASAAVWNRVEANGLPDAAVGPAA